jgi:hypothetical protein
MINIFFSLQNQYFDFSYFFMTFGFLNIIIRFIHLSHPHFSFFTNLFFSLSSLMINLKWHFFKILIMRFIYFAF